MEEPTYLTKMANGYSFYNYYLESQLYDGHNIDTAYVEDQDDGIIDYDIVYKDDNRKYMPFILYDLNKNIRYYDFANLVVWAKTFLNNPLDLHVISDTDYQTVNISLSDIQNFITINGPTKLSKYCPGYIKPETIDIFKFNGLNHKLEEVIQSDMSLSNINLSGIENIESYTIRAMNGKNNLNYRFISKNIITPARLITTMQPGT